MWLYVLIVSLHVFGGIFRFRSDEC